jgi:hypothetical protein
LTTYIPWHIGGAPSQKPHLKNSTVEKNNLLAGMLPQVKSPISSHLIDNNQSPNVGGASSQMPFSEEWPNRTFFDSQDDFGTLKLNIIRRLFDKKLAPTEAREKCYPPPAVFFFFFPI